MSNNEKNVDKRVKRTKQALKQSLMTLMKQKELKEITIKNIVEHADYNRGTFYKHYKFKEDLLDEIIDDIMADLVKSFREPYQNQEIFEVEKLSSSAIKIFEHVERNATFYQLMLKSNAIPGFEKRMAGEFQKLMLLDLVTVNGHLLNVNSEVYANYYSYAFLGIIVGWVEDDFRFSPSYMAELLLEIIRSNAVTHKYITRSPGDEQD